MACRHFDKTLDILAYSIFMYLHLWQYETLCTAWTAVDGNHRETSTYIISPQTFCITISHCVALIHVQYMILIRDCQLFRNTNKQSSASDILFWKTETESRWQTQACSVQQIYNTCQIKVQNTHFHQKPCCCCWTLWFAATRVELATFSWSQHLKGCYFHPISIKKKKKSSIF